MLTSITFIVYKNVGILNWFASGINGWLATFQLPLHKIAFNSVPAPNAPESHGECTSLWYKPVKSLGNVEFFSLFCEAETNKFHKIEYIYYFHRNTNWTCIIFTSKELKKDASFELWNRPFPAHPGTNKFGRLFCFIRNIAGLALQGKVRQRWSQWFLLCNK